MKATLSDVPFVGYTFHAAPPALPRLWFQQRHLLEMALFGCRYVGGGWEWQRTVFPGDGTVGRWIISGERSCHRADELRDALTSHTSDHLCDLLLPHLNIDYEDFGTRRHAVWVLTDQVLRHPTHPPHTWRLGLWPD